jgi:hypothetical protein
MKPALAACLALSCACAGSDDASNNALAGSWLLLYSDTQASGRMTLSPGAHGVSGDGVVYVADGGTDPFTVASQPDQELVVEFPDGRKAVGFARILPNCAGQPIPPIHQVNRIIAPGLGVAARDPPYIVVCAPP